MEKNRNEPRHNPRIAVNVMRARQTVLGFNIAIVSFQIVQMRTMPGGVVMPGADHPLHIIASFELHMALGLAMISMLAFLLSSELDEVGICSHWSLVTGDILMYLSIAYTVAGFFGPLDTANQVLIKNLPVEQDTALILLLAMRCVAGSAWLLAMYVGPVVSLMRSPFEHRINYGLGVFYVLTLVILIWINSQARGVELETAGKPWFMIESILKELLQPLWW